MKIFLSLFLLCSFYIADVYAQSPDFDNGIDASREFKKALSNSSLQICIPLLSEMDLPVEPSTAAKTDAKKGAGLLPAEAGYLIGGPYPRYIENSAAYKTGVTYPPLLQDNSDPAADELLSIWDEIDKARAPMLQDAASLDVKDSGMYTELGKLTAETDAVNAEREKWIAAVQNFNAKCANGQPVSYSWCQNEQKRVLAWQKDLEARIEVHNQKAKDFDKRADLPPCSRHISAC